MAKQNYFNPRPPQGERPYSLRWIGVLKAISIHAPRKGSDVMQSDCDDNRDISIHAPRKGSDVFTYLND